MDQLSYRRHRFPPIIQHAIWLYLRFTLSYRDVEDLLAERCLDVSLMGIPTAIDLLSLCVARQRRNARVSCLGVLGLVRLSIEKPLAFGTAQQSIGAFRILDPERGAMVVFELL